MCRCHRQRKAEPDIADAEQELAGQYGKQGTAEGSVAGPAQCESKRSEHKYRDDSADTVHPVDRGQRLYGQRTALCIHAKFTHDVKAVADVHLGHQRAAAGRQVGTGQRCIIGTDPAAKRYLGGEHNEGQRSEKPQRGSGGWPGWRQRARVQADRKSVV